MSLLPDSPLAQAFVPASHYQRAERTSEQVQFFVVHTAECSLVLTAAEALQGYFHAGSTGVSTQYAADPDSVEQSVPEAAVAYAAGHHGNLLGIHLELAGRARETVTDWASPDNRRMLLLAAELLADVCSRWDLPLVFVDHVGLLAGVRGVTTHAEIAKAWPKETNHTDPGTSFPMADVLALARTFLVATDPPPTLPSGTPPEAPPDPA